MPKVITECEVEDDLLRMLADMGYATVNGTEIDPDSENPERSSWDDVVLVQRLESAISSINPKLPNEAVSKAVKKVLQHSSGTLEEDNFDFHKLLSDGVDIDYREDGRIKNSKAWLFDFKNPESNDFLAVNQFTIIEGQYHRRPDIVIFVNGIPLVVIELKNPADEKATLKSAYNQLQTYKAQIPSIFRFNEILIISDGISARAGSLTANTERFMAWKTVGGSKPTKNAPQLATLACGMLNKETLLDLCQNFITFDKSKKGIKKILAAYHQYNATNNALDSTTNAVGKDKRAGVVWHTQGSGKSLTMVFYAAKIVRRLDNPTIVVLTDRNDLDDQLFGTFSKAETLLRQKPQQADSRAKIKELLNVASGGIVFTTIQKFFPEEKGDKYPCLSERKNIVVIADEAHRSQYDFIDGFARHMRDALPNASFIGFTGTPIAKSDKNTRAVFGKYVDVYDITQAVEDEATVRIYYESRLAKLDLKPESRPVIDDKFEEVTEGEELDQKERLKTQWSRLEALAGAPERTKKIAQDIVAHFEEREKGLKGKAMIVCMSRRICVNLYREIVKLRPNWHDEDDKKGQIKVVMTGSASDPLDWQEHIRNKPRRRALGDRFKDPEDSLKLVIVRDMWLTGFDAPCLHTMYVDKPMRGHGLMQAIARVNRVFKDKPGGLVVDYMGIANELRKALNEYSESDKQQAGIPQEEAVALTLEKFEVVSAMFHGFNYKKFFSIEKKDKQTFLNDAADVILGGEDLKNRFVREVTALSKAFALAVPHPEALKIRDDLAFFQAVKSLVVKTTQIEAGDKSDIDSAINQIISEAVVSDRVIDIFAAAGLKKPNIGILSEEFLAEVKGMPQKNLAFEMLKKLLNDEIRLLRKKNIVSARSFQELLDKAIRKYTNKSIETAEVIEELINISREMRSEKERGKKLDMNEDEVAFYDALAENGSAVKVLGDEKLRDIARELVKTVRNNVSIDWTERESARARLRVMVKRVLKKYGYPPDKQEKATKIVLLQASMFGDGWAENVN